MINRMGLKGKNRNNVYKLIYDSNGISKQDIAQILNLSLPTVSQNLTELKEKGLIGEYGTFESTGGRKARIIRAINDAKLALGLDITSNHISLVLVDMQGKVLNSIRLRFEYRDAEDYYQGIGQVIDSFVAESKINSENILGLGISLPAIIKGDNQSISYISVIKAPENLYERMGKYMKVPYLFFNDANAGCFAEFWRRDSETPIVYISLSNSVGGAILYTKSVYLGENQRSGEFGHITLEKDGRQCYCGQKGCADTYCNAKVLSDLTDGNVQQFFEQLHQGDAKCLKAFEEYLNYLAMLVNNLRMSFDCDVVLGGYVGSHMEKHVDKLTKIANSRNPFEKNGNYIKVCNYKFEASAVGAALHYLDDYINNI